MAGIKSVGNENTTKTSGFSFGRSGNTLRAQSEIRITTFQLREIEEDPVRGRIYGNVVTGQQAVDIVTSHNVAHREQIIARLKKDIISFKAVKEVTPVTRNIQPGQTVQDRAAQYIRGIVLGAVNTCPTKLTVGGKTYIYEKRNITRFLDPSEAIKLFTNEAYVGSAQGAKLDFVEDEDTFNQKCIDKATFEEAINEFCKELQPRVQGSSLYLNGVQVAIFSAINEEANVIAGASTFDETEVSVAFSQSVNGSICTNKASGKVSHGDRR